MHVSFPKNDLRYLNISQNLLIDISFFLPDECIQKDNEGKSRLSSQYNNKKACEEKSGRWLAFHNYLERAPQFKTKGACEGASKDGVKYIWGRALYFPDEEVCLVALPKPECKEGLWSRVNHLGNGRDGQPLSFAWALPNFPSGDAQRCVLRVR